MDIRTLLSGGVATTSTIIILLILALLIFSGMWFVENDVYFSLGRAKKTKGIITDKVKSSKGVVYKIAFDDSDDKREAVSPLYRGFPSYDFDEEVDIVYVSFKCGKKDILSVRIDDEELIKNESYFVFVTTGFLCVFLAILIYVLSIFGKFIGAV